MNSYDEAHLFVAAIRVETHRKKGPPSLGDVCSLVGISREVGHNICRRLKKLGAIDTVEDPFSIKLMVVDHLQLEEIPRQEEEKNSLSDELKAFSAKKKDMDRKVADIKKQLESKKKDMFADIEARLKKELDK